MELEDVSAHKFLMGGILINFPKWYLEEGVYLEKEIADSLDKGHIGDEDFPLIKLNTFYYEELFSEKGYFKLMPGIVSFVKYQGL